MLSFQVAYLKKIKKNIYIYCVERLHPPELIYCGLVLHLDLLTFYLLEWIYSKVLKSGQFYFWP